MLNVIIKPFTLSVIMLIAIMLSVILLNIILLSVIMLNVIMLKVIKLNVIVQSGTMLRQALPLNVRLAQKSLPVRNTLAYT